MKITLLITFTALLQLCFSFNASSQAPSLGTTADFVLFTTVGAVTNSGISQLTGNVGTNNGSSTFFGNVNGGMHDNDGISAQCSADLLNLYNKLDSATPAFFPAPLLGGGQILIDGVYSIAGAATLDMDLTLNGQGNTNSVFIFQISGPLSVNANSKIILQNGAQACNVFWKVEGLISVAGGSTMRGTFVANNAAINMSTGDTLEGRALSTAGAVSIDGVVAFTPIGCGSPYLTGPPSPALNSSMCYGVFSSNGPVTNNGISFVTGDVGTDVGLTTGFDSSNIVGVLHPIPDVSTTACSADLLNAYNQLNILSNDIELLYPAEFGRNLVLTPHTYIMNAATVLTDTLFLNAQGNSDAVFVIKINGALSTSTYSMIALTNDAEAKNVFWMVDGAVDINDYSVFNGTIICNNGAINLNTGVEINGRALTTTGSVSTSAITVTMPPDCNLSAVNNITWANANGITVYPNPFTTSAKIMWKNPSLEKNAVVIFYNVLGKEVSQTIVGNETTTLPADNFQPGIYFFKFMIDNDIVQSGRVVKQ